VCELLTLQIRSAGKKDQLIGETAAAIYVITSDDVRRSHATTVMELLRQVPGMHVARESTGKWSISIRGFANENANKLLVLIDGRTLYTPVWTGGAGHAARGRRPHRGDHG
jgi:iron complex outermembrane receptor protein